MAHTIRIFQDTPLHDLAIAVDREDEKKIREILQQKPDLKDYKERMFGETVLYWAVGKRKYKSVKTLLDCGADPNIICDKLDGTALVAAVDYPFGDMYYDESPDMLELLLKNGADPNIPLKASEYGNTVEGKDLLSYSIGHGYNKTKLLVDYGADINYCSDYVVTEPDFTTRQFNVVEKILMYDPILCQKEAEIIIIQNHANCLQPKEYMYKSGKNRTDYPIDTMLLLYNEKFTEYPPTKDEKEIYLRICSEMINQCNQTPNEYASKYTLEKIEEAFPELFQ